MLPGVLASIPSPPIRGIEIGALDLRFYGLLIGIGIVLAIVVTRRRYARFGGDPDLADKVALWAVAGGVLGARLAHVSTNLDLYRGRWLHVFAVWEGGLAFFGGLTLGAVFGILAIRWYRGDLPAFADSVAVGIPLAQAVGRWGNYFNQELFGTPTTLPWGLEIDRPNRPPQYAEFETFHPTFLYESLWNVVVVIGVLLLLERRGRMVRGNLFLAYLALYGAGRFVMELIRTDTTFRLLGLSRNAWVSVLAVVAAVVVLAVRQRRAASPEDDAAHLRPEEAAD